MAGKGSVGVYDQPEYYDVATSWDISLERDFILSSWEEHATRPIESVLDLACGSGRLTRELASFGKQLTGLDQNEKMISYCRTRQPEAQALDFRIGDMADFKLGRRFDAVICMLDSLAHIGDWQRLCSHLDRVAKHLAPGGVYVVDFVVATGVKDSWTFERQGVEVTCEYESSSAVEGRYQQRIVFLVTERDGRKIRIENEDDCPVILPSEFNQAAAAVGLKLAGDISGADENSFASVGGEQRYLAAYRLG
jgi:SAM-dependent methyltransferase